MNTERSTSAVATATTEERLQALEFLVGQLVLALDGSGRLRTEDLAHWMALCTRRMRETGSATPRQIAAIEEVAGRVLEARLGPATTQ